MFGLIKKAISNQADCLQANHDVHISMNEVFFTK